MVSFLTRYQFHQIGTPPPSGESRHLRLPLVLPYPFTTHRGFFISPTSHSDLFHSFISWSFVSQPPFPFQVWPDLRVKPRLCRSSWRAFASTHPLMLTSTSSREALLACPPFPPWNLPLFTVESILSSPCSHSPRCGSRSP